MKIYLVGGAVRDTLLGLDMKERDYVVVGATIEDMLKQGFKQVGKDFPVFLHPDTKEEYALARMERKVGRGYTGFTFDTSPTVTLEEDLLRRDITINAMAQTPDGTLIDPYQGKEDLKKKIVRHVSPAFAEDPVRILRVARFLARFSHLGFTVAPETHVLMKQMVQAGEVDALVAERVWKEVERALLERNPEKFFEVVEQCGALPLLFSSVSAQGITRLANAAGKVADAHIRFAVLLQDNTSEQIQTLCDRYRVPNDYRELALLVARYRSLYQRARELSAEELVDLLQRVDAFRREARFNDFLRACEVGSSTSNTAFLNDCYQAAKTADVQDCMQLSGKEIAACIAQKRMQVIRSIIAGGDTP